MTLPPQNEYMKNIHIQARVTAECYSNLPEFSDTEEYLKALTECLDDLALACGYPPPRFE